MKTLLIKDLSVTEQLDSKAMQAVRGGFGPSYYSYSSVYKPYTKTDVDTTQMINNELSLQNANGNNVAFAEGITSTFTPYVTSNNSNFA
ncbi:hypothetical protein LJ655_12970 [Paraburkholderia sp. MMS20-SJTN17]|uniref:Uncharacterized protein n=1 Tax=Paraburkholderia translucens TaxID=2886945 RepID=A0ABS8KDE7_9BURK|nr:hypothetical protein [Paraburkholderia sp. MMS20-SJTN17]MCC8402787.1 hypothetical protein [Paraburkholderia sp. MMS20-SJTN17]